MAWAIDTVTGSAADPAHHKMLGIIKQLAEGAGWQTLRHVTTGDHELILKGNGLSGTEEIFIGFKGYHSVTGDYYNLACATMVGYVADSPFEQQPGICISGVPCHNNAVTYFLTCNRQRIAGCFKVGTPVYEHFYLGKFFPYARPGEFPSPLLCAGMFNGAEGKRFSDGEHKFPYRGFAHETYERYNSYLYMRNQAGAWTRPSSWPWHTDNVHSQSEIHRKTNVLAGGAHEIRVRCLVRTEGYHHLMPVVLHDLTPNVYGELDGVHFVSGMDNGVENVMQIGGTPVNQAGMTAQQAVAAVLAAGGRAFVMLQDVWRTGWCDFIAMEMSA